MGEEVLHTIVARDWRPARPKSNRKGPTLHIRARGRTGLAAVPQGAGGSSGGPCPDGQDPRRGRRRLAVLPRPTHVLSGRYSSRNMRNNKNNNNVLTHVNGCPMEMTRRRLPFSSASQPRKTVHCYPKCAILDGSEASLRAPSEKDALESFQAMAAELPAALQQEHSRSPKTLRDKPAEKCGGNSVGDFRARLAESNSTCSGGASTHPRSTKL